MQKMLSDQKSEFISRFSKTILVVRSSLQMAGKLLRCRKVHELIEKLNHAEEEGSGKDSAKLRVNLNQQV